MAKRSTAKSTQASRPKTAAAPTHNDRIHRSFRRTVRRDKNRQLPKPTAARHLLRDSLKLVWEAKWLFLRTALLHSFLILLFAADRLSESGSVWLLVLLVIMSLALTWMIRQLMGGERPRLKAALYRGTSQVVPYSLLLFLVLIQLIPLAAGLYLFQVVVVGGIAVHFWEQMLFATIWLLLGLLSYYWLMTTLFALYIVALPDMTPMSAWHNARTLVDGRRLMIGLRLFPLFLAIILAGYGLLLVTPADWLMTYNVFWVIIAWLLPIIHVYCYKLYRALT
jgi:hypothetical protein